MGQIEDRLSKGRIDVDFKRKGNKFKKWLNKHPNKDGLLILKGTRMFSDTKMYSGDGVHLNIIGTDKLTRLILDYYNKKKAGVRLRVTEA